MTQRQETFRLDNGHCVACGVKLAAGADSWSWQCHHALKAQVLRRAGVPSRRLRDATFTVLLCRRCHLAHEARIPAPIAFECLPERVVLAIDALGPGPHDLLRIYHPPANRT